MQFVLIHGILEENQLIAGVDLGNLEGAHSN